MLEVLGRLGYETAIRHLGISSCDANTQETNWLVAIRNYTSRRYIDINAGIRNGEKHSKHLKAVRLLVEALDSFPIYDGAYVVRWSNLSDELVEQMKKKGSIIYEQGFTSTSANPEYHQNDKKYRLIIKHLNGRDISAYSEYPNEEEVLIPANSFFKVQHFDEDSREVFLEQISYELLSQAGGEQ